MSMTQETPGGIRSDYPEPLWIQAVNLISGEIENGTLKPGSRLPPERELCLQLGISRVTLRKALNKLVENGVLIPSHGRGWYVADRDAPAPNKEWPNNLESFSETAARIGLTATSLVLRAEVAPASLDEAEPLLIAAGTPIFHLERVRLLNGVPIAIDVTQIPLSLAPAWSMRTSRRSPYSTSSTRPTCGRSAPTRRSRRARRMPRPPPDSRSSPASRCW